MDGTSGHHCLPKTSPLAPMAPEDAAKLTRASAYLVLRPRLVIRWCLIAVPLIIASLAHPRMTWASVLGIVAWVSLSPVAWLVESLLHRRYASALRARGVEVPAALTQWWRAR